MNWSARISNVLREEHKGEPHPRFDSRDRILAGSLAAASGAVNLLLLAVVGLSRGGDTFRYQAAAQDLLARRSFGGPAGWAYAGYNGLLATAEATGVGEVGVVLFQMLVAACATAALYDLGRQLGGRAAGLLAAGFFVVDYDIARWHLYLLTDSLYISLVSIGTWIAHRAVGRGPGAYAAASGVLLFAALVRPNGWILIPIVAIYWIVRSGLRSGVKVASATAVAVIYAGGAMAVAIMQFGGDASPSSRVPGAPQRPNPQTLPFARDLTIRDRLNSRMPIRVLTELAHVKPTFSRRHKVMVVVMLAAVYPLAGVGFVRSRRRPLARLVATVIAGHLMVVAVTFRDPDGRYLLYIFPLFVVFAACGAVALRWRWS
jgi:4-amino-4-deoxy-L-arabinose transferase-like glycosyltransferase